MRFLIVALLAAISYAQTVEPVFEVTADDWAENGNFDDTVGGLQGTVTGTMTLMEWSSMNAVYIGGDNDYIEWPLQVGPSGMPQMSLEILVWLPSIANNRGWVFGDEDGGCDRYILLHDDRVGGLAASCLVNLGQGNPPTEEWIHIIATYDQSSTMQGIYLNGQGSTASGGTHSDGRGALRLGSPWGSHHGEMYFNMGRVYDVMLTAEQVQARYMEVQDGINARLAAEPPVFEVTADAWAENGNWNDLVSGLEGTLTGNIEVQTFQGINAAYIAGDSDYIQWPINIGPSQMPQLTLEMVLWAPSIANNRGWVFGDEDGGCDRYILIHDDRVSGFSPSCLYNAGMGNIPTQQWVHLITTYDQNAQTTGAYLNGEGNEGTSVTHSDGRGQLRLGSPWGSHHGEYYVTMARAYNVVLSPDQIRARNSVVMYDIQVASAMASRVFEVNGDSWAANGNWNDVVSDLTGTMTGAVQLMEWEDLQAAYIAGDSDYIQWDINVGPSNMPQMTLEILLWAEEIANNRGWVFGDEDGGCDRYILIHDDRVGGISPSCLVNLGLGNIPTQEWVHIVTTYDQATSATGAYVNGVGSSTTGASHSDGRGQLRLGSPWGSHHGHYYVHEARVYDSVLNADQIYALYERSVYIVENSGQLLTPTQLPTAHPHCPEIPGNHIDTESITASASTLVGYDISIEFTYPGYMTITGASFPGTDHAMDLGNEVLITTGDLCIDSNSAQFTVNMNDIEDYIGDEDVVRGFEVQFDATFYSDGELSGSKELIQVSKTFTLRVDMSPTQIVSVDITSERAVIVDVSSYTIDVQDNNEVSTIVFATFDSVEFRSDLYEFESDYFQDENFALTLLSTQDHTRDNGATGKLQQWSVSVTNPTSCLNNPHTESFFLDLYTSDTSFEKLQFFLQFSDGTHPDCAVSLGNVALEANTQIMYRDELRDSTDPPQMYVESDVDFLFTFTSPVGILPQATSVQDITVTREGAIVCEQCHTRDEFDFRYENFGADINVTIYISPNIFVIENDADVGTATIQFTFEFDYSDSRRFLAESLVRGTVQRVENALQKVKLQFRDWDCKTPNGLFGDETSSQCEAGGSERIDVCTKRSWISIKGCDSGLTHTTQIWKNIQLLLVIGFVIMMFIGGLALRLTPNDKTYAPIHLDA